MRFFSVFLHENGMKQNPIHAVVTHSSKREYPLHNRSISAMISVFVVGRLWKTMGLPMKCRYPVRNKTISVMISVFSCKPRLYKRIYPFHDPSVGPSVRNLFLAGRNEDGERLMPCIRPCCLTQAKRARTRPNPYVLYDLAAESRD